MKPRALGLLLLIFLLFPLRVFSQQGWYAIPCPIATEDFDAGNDTILSVLNYKSVACSSDGGLTWSSYASLPMGGYEYWFSGIKSNGPGSALVFGLRAEDPTHNVYFALLWMTKDGGKSWTHLRDDPSYGPSYVLMDHGMKTPCYGSWASHGLIGNEWASILDNKFVWSGQTEKICGLDFQDSIGVAISSNQDKTFHINRTTNLGGVWSKDSITIHGPPNTTSVRSCRNTWFIADDRRLLRSVDSGATWSAQATFTQRITGFNFFDSVGYLCLSGADYIERTSNAGLTWYPQSCTDGETTVYNVTPTSYTTAYAWSNSNQIMKCSNNVAASPGPVLSMPRSIDFGQVAASVLQSKTVLARNIGTGTLSVTSVLSDSTNVTVTPTTFSLATGDSITLTVLYTTHNGAGDHIRVAISSNSIPSKQVFTILGSALVPTLSYSTDTLDFGNVRLGETQTKKIRVTNSGKITAKFQTPEVIPSQFYSLQADSVQITNSGILTVRFSARSLGQQTGTLILHSNAFSPDTIVLIGNGVSAEANTLNVDWLKNISTADPLQGIATNVITQSSGIALVSGAVGASKITDNFLDVRFDAQGVERSRRILDLDTNASNARTSMESDGQDGAYLAHLIIGGNLSVLHLDANGDVHWRDTLHSGNTQGVSPDFPILLTELNASGLSSSGVALCCAGFSYSRSGSFQQLEEKGQSLFQSYDRDGHVLRSDTINGSSSYSYKQPPRIDLGYDWATSLLSIGNKIYAAFRLDQGQYPYGYHIPSPLPTEYHSYIYKADTGRAVPIFDEVNRFGSGFLTTFQNRLYEAERANDSSFQLLAFDDSDHIVRRSVIPNPNGTSANGTSSGDIDNFYGVGCDSSGNVFISATSSTEFSGEKASLVRFSPRGEFLWKRTFEGLGSGDDIPVKIILDHDFAYQLVKSMDTSGNDFVLLKYDTSGNLIYRLRYDGSGHGDDVPRDFAIGLGGSIYVVGGATNAQGVKQFTVLKYFDSTLAAVQPQIIPADLFDAQLTMNPWLFSTTLQIKKPPFERISVRVYDILGREYFSQTTTSNTIGLSAGLFRAGFYTMVIEDEHGGLKLLKFIRE
ncbi:MAG: choice-of-anchor D domain-containing protein [Candidatus Kapaibacterium sp.]